MNRVFVWLLAYEVLCSSTVLLAQPVTLNEVLANNRQTPIPGSTSLADWIELQNSSEATADLTDASLSDRNETPRRWVFPAGTILPPHSYLLISCDPTSPASMEFAPMMNTGFGLKGNAGSVILFASPNSGGEVLDFVAYGIQLEDLSIGRDSPHGRWQLNRPTPGLANRVMPTGSRGALRINEWMANPANGDDWFELYNPETDPVDIGGLYLSDSTNKPTQYRIPSLSFIAASDNSFAVFYADNATNKGPDHISFKLNNSGESIALFEADGGLIDLIVFGPQRLGVSEGRFPDGAAEIIALSENPSPGQPNFLPLHAVVFNEVLSHADDPYEDAFELYNPTTCAVDLTGWFLTDNPSKPAKYRIPYGTLIDAGGYQTFYRYQFQPHPGVPPNFGFSSAHGDALYLFASDATGKLTGSRAGVVFPPAPNNIAFGRYLASTGPQFVLVSNVTLGTTIAVSDPPSLLSAFRSGRGAPNAPPVVGPLVINEIMYHPPNLGTNDNPLDEFIELKNILTIPVPLFDPAYPSNHWKLSGAVDYTFTNGVSLQGSATLLVVSFDPLTNPAQLAVFRNTYEVPEHVLIYGPYQGKLNNTGEALHLVRPDIPQFCFDPDFGWVPPILVDVVEYRSTAPWPSAADGTGLSIQRRVDAPMGNDPVYWHAALPTPGRENQPPAERLPKLDAMPQSASIEAGGTLTLSSGPDEISTRCQWRFNGLLLPDATNATFTITNAQVPNSGDYSVLVSNPYGASAATVAVSVLAPPALRSQPADQRVPQGGEAVFGVTACGTPPFSYQWMKEGTAILSATNLTLRISNAQSSDSGVYSVRVDSSTGSITSQGASLSSTSNDPPAILAQPRGYYFLNSTPLSPGSSYSLGVTVSGSSPLLYQWMKDDQILIDETNDVLRFQSFQSGQAGNYRVEIRNQFGSVASEPVRLIALIPPAISIHSDPTIIVEAGTDVPFESDTLGTPRLYYQWFVDGRSINGELCSNYKVYQAGYSDAGSYRVMSYSVLGGTNYSQSVALFIRPRITNLQKTPLGFEISFEGTAGRAYALESSTDWTQWNIATTVTNTPTILVSLTDSNAPSDSIVYRVRQLQ